MDFQKIVSQTLSTAIYNLWWTRHMMDSLQIYVLKAKKFHHWHRDGSEAGSNHRPLIRTESRQNKFQVRTRTSNWMNTQPRCDVSNNHVTLAQSSIIEVIFSSVRGWCISEAGLRLGNESLPKLSTVRSTSYTSLVSPSPRSMNSKTYIYLLTLILSFNSRYATKMLLPLERACNNKCVPSVIHVNQYATARQPGTMPTRRV